jgi:hypothetical protein
MPFEGRKPTNTPGWMDAISDKVIVIQMFDWPDSSAKL